MIKYPWKIDRFNGGQSDDSKIGLPGSARWLLGNDIYSDSGLLQVAKKPTKFTTTGLDQIIKWIVPYEPMGYVFYYGGAKIWLSTATGGSWTLTHTITGGSDQAGQGMAIFQDKLYYACRTHVGRTNNILFLSSWTDEWAALTATTYNNSFIPMMAFKNLLLIGHGNRLAVVDDTETFEDSRLVLPTYYVIRNFEIITDELVAIVATYTDTISNSERGFVFFWDGTSESYNDFMPIDGNPHFMISHLNSFKFITGTQPVIQESSGGSSIIKQAIPNVTVGKTLEVYPGAVDKWSNRVYFGISAGTDTTATRCVYGYGSKNSSFPNALNPEFPVSEGSYNSTVQITALKKVGVNLMFAWKVGSIYGIDIVDTTAYLTQAIYRSLVFDRESAFEKVAQKLVIEFAGALKTGETVTAKISKEPYDDPTFADTTTLVTKTENTVGAKRLELPLTTESVPIRSRDLHLEVRYGGSGTTRPKIKRIITEIDEEDENL